MPSPAIVSGGSGLSPFRGIGKEKEGVRGADEERGPLQAGDRRSLVPEDSWAEEDVGVVRVHLRSDRRYFRETWHVSWPQSVSFLRCGPFGCSGKGAWWGLDVAFQLIGHSFSSIGNCLGKLGEWLLL